MVYLMREEDGTKKEIVEKLGREIQEEESTNMEKMRINLVSVTNKKEGLLLHVVHRACIDMLVDKEQQIKETVKNDNVAGESVMNKISLVDQLC